MDISDLETFGETTSKKTAKTEERQNERVVWPPIKSPKTTISSPLSKMKMSSESLSLQTKVNTSWSQPIIKSPLALGEAVKSTTKQKKPDSAQESDESETDDDEKLVIDHSGSSGTMTPTKTAAQPKCETPQGSVKSNSSSPQKTSQPRRQSRGQRAKVLGDQLGEILCMQTAMFNSARSPARSSSSVTPESSSSTPGPEPTVYSHPTSLVKPCVTSYLERKEKQDGESGTPQPEPAPSVTEHKSWYPIHLYCVNSLRANYIVSASCMQEYCQKTFRPAWRMEETTKLQRRETCCTSSTVCRICCSWCEARCS